MDYTSALLTDLDDTLYSWVDFWAPCFRSMVHVIHGQLGAPEDEVTAQFREVYARHGSVEYQFSVQELELARGLAPTELDALVRRVKGAYNRVREARLQPYPAVKETLQAVAAAGIAVVGVTNAPLFLTTRRLAQLRLDHLFAGLAAWEGFEAADDNPYVKHRQWQSRIPRTWSFPKDLLKPNTHTFRAVLHDIGIPPDRAWVVGDSLEKDIRPALEIGAQGIWARYGMTHEQENMDTLLRVTHWGDDAIERVYAVGGVQPSRAIDRFDELLDVLPVQLGLSL